jgi:hypothetical protein
MTAESLGSEQTKVDDETVPPKDGAGDDAPDDHQPARSRLVVGFVLTAAFFLFLAFGSVAVQGEPTQNQPRETREMRVYRIWTLLHDNLPQVDNQGLLQATLDVALAVLVLTITGCLWLALFASQDVDSNWKPDDGGA